MPSDAIVEGVSGAIGGCVATIATYPLMTITTRQVTSVKKATEPQKEGAASLKAGAPAPTPTSKEPLPPSILEELARTVRTSGWTSLFSGLSASLMGTTVSQGIYFYLYSLLRQAAVRRRTAGSSSGDPRSAEIAVSESLMIAALAGMGNVLLTNPIWMVATRMQAHRRRPVTGDAEQGGENIDNNAAAAAGASTPSLDIPAPGPVAVAREVYSEYGLRGFWNGVGASLVMVINPTIQYAIYEWLREARAKVRPGGAAKRASAGEVFLLSALAKAGATILTFPLLTVKTRMMSARRGDAHIQYSSVLDAVLQIARREGVGGYYKGMPTKMVQSVLAAALLFMCKEKITDATRDVLLYQQRKQAVVAVA